MDEAQEAEALRSQIVDLSATLQGQIDLLVRIADEFSTLARLPQGEVARVSLRSVLESVVSLHQRAGQDLVLEMASDAAIEADEDQLRRMLGNLILNAQQAVEEKGSRVVVRATEQMIEVEDDGPGMPQEVAERAFEPQFTTRGSGSGLGLAIVKAICDRHGWRVEFESISVTGTAFRILFDA